MRVAILTIEQKDILYKQELSTKWKFNSVQDINEDWVISEEEIIKCTNPDFEWVKILELTDWLGPYTPEENIT
jgi:hypothetical protein